MESLTGDVIAIISSKRWQTGTLKILQANNFEEILPTTLHPTVLPVEIHLSYAIGTFIKYYSFIKCGICLVIKELWKLS